ncbi:MAG: hypothetical protein ACTIJY_08125 [Luteimonas sp.]
MRFGRGTQKGAATIEYTIVTALFVIALLAPTNTFSDLMDAIKQVFQAFTYTLSVSYPAPVIDLD